MLLVSGPNQEDCRYESKYDRNQDDPEYLAIEIAGDAATTVIRHLRQEWPCTTHVEQRHCSNRHQDTPENHCRRHQSLDQSPGLPRIRLALVRRWVQAA
jgi:hypothetical protein